ncbi:hypothetical protein [Acidovorax sp. JHL-9]|uniref:hypothetical protein n=1 Tax=Acidovorax sp. JHL-9 TaxID=1276756 RepID=UPI0004275756|nr:hypothetical protein [Acidovorax sp. JHL-9]
MTPRTANPRAWPTPRPALACILIAISAFATSATGQNDPKSTAACPAAVDLNHQHLQGRWHATLQAATPDAAPAPATTAVLQLGPHPELAESVRGTVQRGGASAQLSGDVDAGELALEESVNGTNISATWTGQVVEGSCGKEIRGTWNNVHPSLSLPFVLRKQPGWQ